MPTDSTDDSTSSASDLASRFGALAQDAVSGQLDAGQVLGASVRRVTIETSVFPALTLTPTYAPGTKFTADGRALNPDGTPASSSAWIFDAFRFLKPKVTLEPAIGPTVSFAPYGPPAQSYFPHLLGTLGLAVAGLAFLKGARSVAKPLAIGAGVVLAAGLLKNRLASS